VEQSCSELNLTLTFADVQMQVGGSDCGVFAPMWHTPRHFSMRTEGIRILWLKTENSTCHERV